MDKEQLIQKWLNNDLSEADSEAFEALEDANLYKEIIEEAKRFDGNINAKVSSFDVLEKTLISKKTSSTRWIKIVSSLAAIFVIGFGLFYILNTPQTNAIHTGIAQNETITLPDNSRVKLNELSQLEYIRENWNNERVLELQGEAFFDVEKGKQFDVNTKFGTVSVLGTEFNVFSRDSVFKVSCYEGLVQVSYDNQIVKLPAGTELVLVSGNGQKSSIPIREPYWLNDMSVFENASLNAVFKELEKHYNITMQHPVDTYIKFTGAFEHNNLENALKSITKPLNLTYTILNTNEVIIKDEQR